MKKILQAVRDWFQPACPVGLASVPPRGGSRVPAVKFYGGSGTIHHTRYLDVEVYDGCVVSVWFRCMHLPFQVTEVGLDRALEMNQMYKSAAPELHGVQVRTHHG